MDSIACAKAKIRSIIFNSKVPEDPMHAENVLQWVLKLKPNANEALQIAALAHDIDRANEKTKVKRADFDDYDNFKAAHARHGAIILEEILVNFQVETKIIEQACELVVQHEVGGDVLANLLKDADSISFFEVNMPLYYAREGYAETLRRCIWGYQRLSTKMKPYLNELSYQHQVLYKIVQETLSNCEK